MLISEMSAKVEKNREVLGRELGELNKELAKSVK